MDEPKWEDTSPVQQEVPQQNAISQSDPSAPSWDETTDLNSVGQTIGATIEGGLQGAIGPAATLGEAALSKAGVPGLSPEEQQARAEAHPYLHGAAEAGTFAASMLAGVGEARAIGAIGEGAVKAASAIPRAAELAEKYPIISKIASGGIRTGAEMAALQTGDEISKAINQDPNQSIGSVVSNVGLSGLIGGIGGGAVGGVSSLWKAGVEKAGIPKLIDEAKAQYGARMENPDTAAKIHEELSNRINEMRSVRSNISDIKGEALEKAMPEVTDKNTQKINDHLIDISNLVTKKIESVANNPELKSSIPYIQYNLENLLEKAAAPESSYAEKFDALNQFKRKLDSFTNFKQDIQSSALGKVSEELNSVIRPALEDEKVWGDAGRIQKETNKAISNSIEAEKAARAKFTVKDMNGIRVSEDKVNSLLNRGEKGKAIDAISAVKDYLKHTDNLEETINKIHTSYGLDAPISLTPTPVLDSNLGRSSSGYKLGNWLYDNGLGNLVGHGAAEATGAGLGFMVGHPGIGAYLGEKMLSPIFTSIAKPLMENATNSVGAKAAIDYAASVIKGDKLLNSTAQNIFKSGYEILPHNLMPNGDSRKKLEKSLQHIDNIDNLANVGSGLNHYLPNHASAAVSTATTAREYFGAIKPQITKNNPLDKDQNPDHAQTQMYNRQLDIAQQPLYALQHVKNGTLLPQDIKTLNTIYPSLHQKMIQKTFESMTKALDDGHTIPYHQKQSLALFMGRPLDSTMTPGSMQSIIMSNSHGIGQSQIPGMGHQKSVTNKAMSSIEKVDKLYATPSQSRLSRSMLH